MVLLGMIVLVYIYEVVFVFPLIARFDNTTINMLKNAVLIPISRLPYAVFVLGLSGMCVCVTLLNRTTIMIGAVVWSMMKKVSTSMVSQQVSPAMYLTLHIFLVPWLL